MTITVTRLVAGLITATQSQSAVVGRRRGVPRRAVWVVAATTAVLVLVAGCAEPAVKLSSHPDGAPITLTVAPGPRVLGACIDPSGSTPGPFSTDTLTAISAAVRTSAPPPPAQPPTTGAPAAPGLDVTVRGIATASFSSATPSRHVVVPSVPGLPAQPNVNAPDALSDVSGIPAWNSLAKNWAHQVQAATDAARHGADTLAALPLDGNQMSGITGCVAALGETAPGHPRRFLVASDLDENVPTQTAGDLHGDTITVIQPCPTGDATACAHLANAFTAWTTARGGRPPTVTRPENLSATVATWADTP